MIQNNDEINGNKNIEIFGGMINGNKANQVKQNDELHTIRIKNVNNFYIHDTKIINGWTSAIRTSFSNNVTIENNIIDNSGDDGIAINEQTAFSIIRANVISNSGQNNKQYGSPTGIEIQDGANNVIVTENTVINSETDGIQVSTHKGKPAPYNIVIVGNTIKTANRDGITFHGQPESILLNSSAYGNYILDAERFGIFIASAKNILVNSNFISSSEKYGIISTFLGSGYNTISNNFITQSQLDGIYIDETSINDKVFGNMIYNNGQSLVESRAGITVKGKNTLVYENLIEDTRIDSERTQLSCINIQDTANNAIVQGNTCINNINDPLIQDKGTNSTISNNIFKKHIVKSYFSK